MPALNGNEKKIIDRLFEGKDVLCSTAVRLYEAQNPREYTYKITGGVVLCHAKGRYQIAMVDLTSGQIKWSTMIQGDIKYKQDKSCFHSFVGSSNMVGLSFADEEDSLDFKEKVLNREHYTPKPIPAPIQYGSSESVSKKSNGVLGRKSTKDKKSKIDKSMISGPSDFQHVSHIGFSATTGYNVENIPTEWKIIFEKAGITDEQLKDKKQMKLAKKFMRENAGLLEAQKAESTTSKPPATRRAAPPPPPSRVSVSKAQPIERAAPPPPLRAAPVRPDTPAVQAAIPFSVPAKTHNPPAIPDRVAPAIPGRMRPNIPDTPSKLQSAPPPPIKSTGVPPPPVSSGGPPPPPPMPTATSLPPTRPPVLPPTAPKQQSQSPKGNEDLLLQIREGGQLKKASDIPIPAEKMDLLSQIRMGTQLKSVSHEDRPEPVSTGGDALADALRNALQKRSNALAGSDSDSDDDEDGEEDW